jgi:hypothetical protein
MYWRADALKNKPTSKTYENADENAKHLEGLVYGTKTPVEAKIVFDKDPLKGKLVPAEKFMLATSEFDSILEWVKATPTPKHATGNLHGSVSGILQFCISGGESSTASTILFPGSIGQCS